MSDIRAPLNVDPRCTVVGELYFSENFEELGRDMVETHPNGVLISAGWYPESSPEGSDRIETTIGMRELLPDKCTTDVFDAAGIIEGIAAELCQRDSALSRLHLSPEPD